MAVPLQILPICCCCYRVWHSPTRLKKKIKFYNIKMQRLDSRLEWINSKSIHLDRWQMPNASLFGYVCTQLHKIHLIVWQINIQWNLSNLIRLGLLLGSKSEIFQWHLVSKKKSFCYEIWASYNILICCWLKNKDRQQTKTKLFHDKSKTIALEP